MLTMLITLVLILAGDVAQIIYFAPPPLDPTNLLHDIFTWLVRILGAVGMVFFVIDFFKHVATSPRDLRTAGIDALVMAILIATAAKADVLVAWAQTAL